MKSEAGSKGKRCDVDLTRDEAREEEIAGSLKDTSLVPQKLCLISEWLTETSEASKVLVSRDADLDGRENLRVGLGLGGSAEIALDKQFILIGP